VVFAGEAALGRSRVYDTSWNLTHHGHLADHYRLTRTISSGTEQTMSAIAAATTHSEARRDAT
jgi:hypothetical protein